MFDLDGTPAYQLVVRQLLDVDSQIRALDARGAEQSKTDTRVYCCSMCHGVDYPDRTEAERRRRETVVNGRRGRSWSRRVVESEVHGELQSLQTATDRPGLAQISLALARVLDNPKAVSSHPPAARVLLALLEKLRSASR